jgi:hypothetical protein
MTKKEMINQLINKVQKAQPEVKALFIRNLKYRSKAELQRLLDRVKVDKDGYGIEL